MFLGASITVVGGGQEKDEQKLNTTEFAYKRSSRKIEKHVHFEVGVSKSLFIIINAFYADEYI